MCYHLLLSHENQLVFVFTSTYLIITCLQKDVTYIVVSRNFCTIIYKHEKLNNLFSCWDKNKLWKIYQMRRIYSSTVSKASNQTEKKIYNMVLVDDS